MEDSDAENKGIEPSQSDSKENLTILFADIAGSTSLYDRLGDKKAHPIITLTLEIMSQIITEYRGIVVEIIGDEIMSRFYNANDAITAADKIQHTLAGNTQLSARIGLQTGITGMHNDHPFGNVVNVAARMTSLAKAGKVIISNDTKQALNSVNQIQLRPFDYVKVKGKDKALQTYEYIWDQLESTNYVRLSPIRSQIIQPSRVSLICRYKSLRLCIDQDHTKISIGRSEHSDITIDSDKVSREHASIELFGGRIIYIDHSTNGSYFSVKETDSNTHAEDLNFVLHRDEWVMSGKGVVCIGEPVDQCQNSILFELPE